MERVLAEARVEGSPFGDIKRRIDGKGVVIFTLANGGSVRDSGKDVFFSAGDTTAETMALLYAQKKWGKNMQIEGNMICRDTGHEQGREQMREQDGDALHEQIPRRGMER